MEEDWDPDRPMDDGNPMGTPEAELHWRVDVRDRIERKRAALASHASQTSDVGMMLAMPPEVFTAVFGFEHFIEPGAPRAWSRAGPSPATAVRGARTCSGCGASPARVSSERARGERAARPRRRTKECPLSLAPA